MWVCGRARELGKVDLNFPLALVARASNIDKHLNSASQHPRGYLLSNASIHFSYLLSAIPFDSSHTRPAIEPIETEKR